MVAVGWDIMTVEVTAAVVGTTDTEVDGVPTANPAHPAANNPIIKKETDMIFFIMHLFG